MMQKGQRGLFIGLVLVVIITISCCQKYDRRAVTEHQFLHDRGRSMQSLKRLIWLSSAIERLHTAQTRSVSHYLNQDKDKDAGDAYEDTAQYQPVRDSSFHLGALQMLLSDMYRPHTMATKK